MAKDWKNKAKDWIQQKNTRSDEFTQSNDDVNNPTAPKPKLKRKSQKAYLNRAQRLFRVRLDYQEKFDELVARMKYAEGKNAPALIIAVLILNSLTMQASNLSKEWRGWLLA